MQSAAANAKSKKFSSQAKRNVHALPEAGKATEPDVCSVVSSINQVYKRLRKSFELESQAL